MFADERIGAGHDHLEVLDSRGVAHLETGRDLVGIAHAGAVAVADPAHLVLGQMILSRSRKFGRQRGIDRGHLTVVLGEFGSLADRPLDGIRGLGAVEARPDLRHCGHRRHQDKEHGRCQQPRHTRLHALRRRTASSISAVDPAKEMRSVPVPRARSKSTPGVVATPVSRSIRLQNSRLSLVRCETSA